MTDEQRANRNKDGLKILNDLLMENQTYAANNRSDLNRRFEYDLKVMALTDAIEALCEKQTRESSGCGCACGETDKNFCSICNKIRVEAIREKLERDNPKPLTLEQLLERTKPVWVACPNASWIENGGYYALCNKGEILPPSGQRFTAEVCLSNGWVLFGYSPKEEPK